MRPHLLLLSGLLLAACASQTPAGHRPESSGEARWQGSLSLRQNRVWLQPCQEQRQLLLAEPSDISEAARGLLHQQPQVFADLRGTVSNSQETGADGLLNPQQLYRLEARTPACQPARDSDGQLQARLTDGTILRVSRRGLLLQPRQQPAMAVPYLEEQLPDGQRSFSSEANGHRLELWIAPQHCETSRLVTGWQATLHLDGTVTRGCAWLEEPEQP